MYVCNNDTSCAENDTVRTEWHERASDKDNQSIGGRNKRRTKREESRENRRQVRFSVLCGEGKLKQLTALALTRVKGEKRPARSEKRRISGEIRLGGCEQGRERERERGGSRRTRGLCGRDSIKRTHINESFQSKTELYAGASISTRVRHACTYT